MSAFGVSRPLRQAGVGQKQSITSVKGKAAIKNTQPPISKIAQVILDRLKLLIACLYNLSVGGVVFYRLDALVARSFGGI